MNEFRSDDSMTSQEAEQVVRRFQESAQGDGRPRVADVAEALGTSPDVVAKILAEVRRQPIAKTPTKTKRPKWRALVFAGATAAAVALCAVATINVLASMKVPSIPDGGVHSSEYATPVSPASKVTYHSLDGSLLWEYPADTSDGFIDLRLQR